MTTRRQERKEAKRAEFEASLRQAEEHLRLTNELPDPPSADPLNYKKRVGYVFGLPGLAIAAALDAKKRPDSLR